MTGARFDVGPLADDAEAERYLAVATSAFASADDPIARRWFDRTDRGTMRVVRDGAAVLGGLCRIPMGQWFGGRSVSMIGIGAVAIAPEHRSRGAAGALMRDAVVEARRDGFALSALYPATQPLYRSVGYERAGAEYKIALDPKAIDVGDRSLELRAATAADEPAMRASYAHCARAGAGLLDRSDWMWERVLRPTTATCSAYVVVGAAGLEGHVVYKKQPGADGAFDLFCTDVVATTHTAARRIATFFADHRSVIGAVLWRGSTGDPVLAVLREQSPATLRIWDWWMLRIVDVERAMTQRGYLPGVAGELHLDVADGLVSENAGKWRLRVADGRAEVVRGGDGAVRLDVRGLAALYTGFQSAAELRASGLVDASDTDLAAATALFAGPSPWMADHF
jgi:predicted acetyltransferase